MIDIKIIITFLLILTVGYLSYKYTENFDVTPSSSATPSTSATPYPSATATASATPYPSATATPTPSATPYPSATATPYPSATATASATPSATANATPSTTPSLSVTQASIPLITLNPSISAKLLEDATDINDLNNYINSYNVTDAKPFFNNSVLKPNFDVLLKKKLDFDKAVKNTTTLYTNSIDKYAKNINNTQLQIENLMQKIATKDNFANVDVDSEATIEENSKVNFYNINDYRAFREVYVN